VAAAGAGAGAEGGLGSALEAAGAGLASLGTGAADMAVEGAGALAAGAGDAAVGLASDVAIGTLTLGVISAALPDNPLLAGGAVAVAGELLFLLVMGVVMKQATDGAAPEPEPETDTRQPAEEPRPDQAVATSSDSPQRGLDGPQ
tara:strand:- start:2079 stop:2513 length:435 start_codon:yes stop_codon:yes gene_type:complete